MSTINNLINSGNTAIDVKNITGSNRDSAIAAGYSTFVESVTGSPVSIVNMGDGKAKLILSENQASKMSKYFEKVLLSPPSKDKKLYIEMGPVYKPLLIKYAVPAFIAVFAIGYFTRNFIK